MIFVTLGSQKFQFNRLLKKIDDLVTNGIIDEEVFAQIGYSDYKPNNYKFKEFLDREEFAATIEHCHLVITHGGTGAIIGAVKKGKEVIAVPRLVMYGEHVDNHQIQIVRQFDKMNLIYGCYDCDELKDALTTVKFANYNQYISNTEVIIQSLDRYIENL